MLSFSLFRFFPPMLSNEKKKKGYVCSKSSQICLGDVQFPCICDFSRCVESKKKNAMLKWRLRIPTLANPNKHAKQKAKDAFKSPSFYEEATNTPCPWHVVPGAVPPMPNHTKSLHMLKPPVP